MRVLVTGAAGFIGRALTQQLIKARELSDRAGGMTPISELVLADRMAYGNIAHLNPACIKITPAIGDLKDAVFVRSLTSASFESIFHLAADLTLTAEQSPDEAFALNVDFVRQLIAASSPGVPRLIFTSSIAVFGGGLPATVDDRIRPTPTTTYGTHKAMVELLMADATRQGRVDGRVLRLPIVLVRPATPNPTVSDQVASIIREPLAGRDHICLLAPQTLLPVASACAVARALVQLHDVPTCQLPPRQTMNLPALTVSVDEMVRALEGLRKSGMKVGSVTFKPERKLQEIVDGWPKHFISLDASRLGLGSDASFGEIIADYLGQEGARRVDSR